MNDIIFSKAIGTKLYQLTAVKVVIVKERDIYDASVIKTSYCDLEDFLQAAKELKKAAGK